MYQEGRGVEKDNKDAVKWQLKSIEINNQFINIFSDNLSNEGYYMMIYINK